MGKVACTSRKLAGWGRFPVEPCHLYRPEKRADLRAILESGARPTVLKINDHELGRLSHLNIEDEDASYTRLDGLALAAGNLRAAAAKM